MSEGFLVRKTDQKSLSKGEQCFQFKNNIIQSVAYSRMLYLQRQQLHKVIAEFIEETHKDDIASFYDDLVCLLD